MEASQSRIQACIERLARRHPGQEIDVLKASNGEIAVLLSGDPLPAHWIGLGLDWDWVDEWY